MLAQCGRECFKWLLCPVQDDPTASKPTVESFSLNTTMGSPPGEVERVCRENGVPIATEKKTTIVHIDGSRTRP